MEHAIRSLSRSVSDDERLAPPPPQRFYSRPPSARPVGVRDGRSASEPGRRPNIVACYSPSGGVGTSSIAAMLAWALRRHGRTCALVDVDFAAGGLDVLLGQEAEPGLRWSDISAPLGRIEPESLMHELPRWEDVVVLSADPWNGDVPDWWEVEAAVSALARANDVVILDTGHAGIRSTIPVACRVLVVELSVLGLARARGVVNRWRGKSSADASSDGSGGPVRLYAVGMPPSGGRAVAVSAQETDEYLGLGLLGVFARNQTLNRSILSGTGIEVVPRSYRRTLEALCSRVGEVCGDE